MTDTRTENRLCDHLQGDLRDRILICPVCHADTVLRYIDQICSRKESEIDPLEESNGH